MDAEYRSSGPTHLVNNAGPTSASDFPFDVGLRAGAGSVDTVTSAWLALARARQIRAIAVAPGVVEAPRMSGLVASDLGDHIPRTVPLQRFAKPEEIAQFIVFLFLPSAAYVNGVVVPVDGD